MARNVRLKPIQLISATLLLAVGGFGAVPHENMETAKVLPTPAMPFPGYLQQVTDPTFGTSFKRITEPGRPILQGRLCNPAYCRHRYSSTQAWNADQSLLVIAKGCGGLCFLDGQTYEPLFWRRIPKHNDCKWHPVDPDLMICVHGNGISTWAPRTNARTNVFSTAKYRTLQFGPWKGNPSQDGTRVAVRALRDDGQLVVFAYDIPSRKKFPDIELASLSGKNRHCSISPSGRYIYLAQRTSAGIEQAYVFTIAGVQLQHWTEHHRPGHGDMTTDADGHDVYVGISKSDPDRYHVIKRRLVDSVVTVLAPYGDARHASLRNINKPGWVFVSYSGSHSKITARRYPAPFYREVVAIRIDGSGEVRRIAQTRAADHDYIAETHASPSPDGTQVIWASNWGQAGGPVASYVGRLLWSKPAASR